MNNPFNEIDARLTNIETLLLDIKHKPEKENLNVKLSISEVAKELGVTDLTVHNYIKRGTLPASKMGNRVWIKRIDLDEALKEVKSLKYKR